MAVLVGRKQRAKAGKILALRHLRGHQAMAAHAEHGIEGLLGCQAIVLASAEPATPLCKIPSIIFGQTCGLSSFFGTSPLTSSATVPSAPSAGFGLQEKESHPRVLSGTALSPLGCLWLFSLGSWVSTNCRSGRQSHTPPLSFGFFPPSMTFMHIPHPC